jgi:hypothetical protein
VRAGNSVFLGDKSGALQQKRQQYYTLGQRIAVLPAAVLLGSNEYRHYFEKLQELSDLPDEHFQVLIHQFVARFVEYVQVIPSQPDMPLATLLTEALLRGINCLHYLVAEYSDVTVLERYAMFTSAVLLDVGHIRSQYKILITDTEGKTNSVWNPLKNPLHDNKGGFYKLLPLGNSYQHIDVELAVMLAKQMMGDIGYHWLTGNIKLLSDWIASLSGDQKGGARISLVHALYKDGDMELFFKSLPDFHVDMLDCPKTEHGDAFYRWLLDGIENDTIKVNSADASVHITDQGVFLDQPAIFKQFAEFYSAPVNHHVVFAQFGNLMGLTKLSGQDFKHAQFFSGDQGARSSVASSSSPFAVKQSSTREGVLIGDPAVVFRNKSVPNVSSDLRSTKSQSKGDLPGLASKASMSISPDFKQH